ncbi:YwaF family protein [Sutcliffiella rhizosphaerae]|uniref:TIGR02206 family membrane protein n=1 Tax=Sutcliffiella rhizosphaerae TaxID=2880967 RepID=A0ABM8YL41_9BACI|nr:TIGR02206 family membrane protein [Sutcliffiella rhizosphaerae]CAG9620650.1 hypothetical protein BACCIP111883_01419 [Sutcliffiella rhizosphaerae]
MYTKYMDPDSFMKGPLIFSSTHLIALIITIFLIITLYNVRNFQLIKGIGRWGLVIFLVGSELWLNYWYFITDMWDIRYTLPLQLCSISLYICTWMLLTKQKWAFELAYFLGLGGAIQALLTPELFYDFPHLRFIHFFVAHIAIVLAVFYMLWVEKYRIKIKSMWIAFFVLQGIAVFVFFINTFTGGNYMFLAKKPANASLIDYLGPYPWYIISLEILVLVIFLLLYLPFYILGKKDENEKRLEV